MSTTAKASDHVKPCNIEQSERHNRRDAEYIASLNPRILYVRTDLSPNNESYVAPNMQGITLQQHYDAIKAMVKQKTGRAMQEKKVTVIGKNGKPKERNGSSPIRESVVNIKSGTTMHDLLKYTDKVHERWGIRAIQIHIHKDEGHYENPDDPTTWKPNLHAHIIWDWMNHETGKSFKLGKKDMEELQDMAAETLEMERGQRKAETGREHLERNDFILQKQETEMEKNQKELEDQKAEIEQMAKASMFDKLLNSGLSPKVRKVLEEKEAAHKEELRQASIAVDENGKTFEWASGDKKGQLLTWNELLKFREKRHKEEMAKVVAEKEAAIAEKETAVAKVKKEAKTELDATIDEMKEVYGNMIKKERLAYSEDGRPIVYTSGPQKDQQATKEDHIKYLNKKIAKQEESNNILLERLKTIRDFLLAGCGKNFKKVIQIIIDQWKAEVKHFSKTLKDFLQEAMSSEETTDGRKSYVRDAFWYAKIIANTYLEWQPDEKKLQPLQEDANRIADGTWDSYHQQHDRLFDAAVGALVEMGNCSSQRHLNQEQTNAIEAFLVFEGGDRTQLCSDIWDKAKPQVEYYWRDGTFDALEELRTGELYERNYSRGRGI